VPRHRRDIDLGHVINADRCRGSYKGDRGREVGEAATVEILVGDECGDPTARPLDDHPAPHGDGMALNAELELVESIIG
jgi:hypothetical protein